MSKLNYGEAKVALLISEAEKGYGESAQRVTRFFIEKVREGKGVHDNNLLNFVADALERALDDDRYRACITKGGKKQNAELRRKIMVMKTFGANNKQIADVLGVTVDFVKKK